MKKEKPFKTEAELCAYFIAAIDAGWTAYAETCGWDILLVRDDDGFQIGIQAKLKLNAAVISQTLEDSWPKKIGPDCRAVLVPGCDAGGFHTICAYIGITIIAARRLEKYVRGPLFTPSLPKIDNEWSTREWCETATLQRHPLPEYVPDVAAGSSAPVQLTPWKIAALKISATVELRGFVTRADFKHHGIDYRRWIASGFDWLKAAGNGHYIAGANLPQFKTQHPKVYAEILADADKWMLRQDQLPTVLL